ncbi:MAG: hypothetical protein ACKVUS_19040 [Saprospiraceae bacterium]
MFNLQYAILSKVEASHQYYKDGRCREVLFEPSQATLAVADEHNLRFGKQPGALKIIGKVLEENGTLSTDPPVTSPLCLQFLLKTADSSLGATAELGGIKKFYLSNLFPDFTVEHPVLTQGAVLSSTEACPPVFPNTFSKTVQPGKFKSLTAQRYWPGGLVLASKTTLEATKETIAIGNLPDGRYRLEWDNTDGSGIEQEEIFVSSEARDSSNWLAIVEIFLTPALLADLAAPPVFSFAFRFKTKPWTYFIVDWKTKSEYPDGITPPLGIEYKIAKNSRLPVVVTFSKLEPASLSPEDLKTREALLQGPLVKEVNVFKSQSSVPFLDGDAPMLKLKDTDNGKIFTLELPVPSSGSPDASVFFNI